MATDPVTRDYIDTFGSKRAHEVPSFCSRCGLSRDIDPPRGCGCWDVVGQIVQSKTGLHEPGPPAAATQVATGSDGENGPRYNRSPEEVERIQAQANAARDWIPKGTVLTTNKEARKHTPIFSGCIRYFPRALAAVAALSAIGNEQHNPGTPLHWDRSKSGDELDALTRHLFEAGTNDTDGVRHSTKVAWRALANLEKELEACDKVVPLPGEYHGDADPNPSKA